MPVPDLWLTVSKYLGSLKAVLAPTETLADMENQEGCKLDRERIESDWRTYEQAERNVRHFMLNEGPQLQRDLKEHANRSLNWVSCWMIGRRVLPFLCCCACVFADAARAQLWLIIFASIRRAAQSRVAHEVATSLSSCATVSVRTLRRRRHISASVIRASVL